MKHLTLKFYNERLQQNRAAIQTKPLKENELGGENKIIIKDKSFPIILFCIKGIRFSCFNQFYDDHFLFGFNY